MSVSRPVRLAALLATVLLVTALPVAAVGTNLAVGSYNSAASDFQTSESLENVSVTSFGDGAVEYGSIIVDDFEDGDITTRADEWDGWAGDTGQLTATTSDVINGTHSGRLTSGSSIASVDTTADDSQTGDFSLWLSIESGSTSVSDNTQLLFRDGGTQLGFLEFEDSTQDLIWNGGSAQTIGSWSVGTTYLIEFRWDFPNDQVEIVRNGTSLGTFNLQSSASGYDFFRVSNDNNNEAGDRDVVFDTVKDGAFGGVGEYISSNHTVSNASQAFTNFTTLTNAEATVEWQNWTGSSWNVVDTSTYTTAGNKTVDISAGAASDKWRVNVTFVNQTTNGEPTAILADEGVQFLNHAPEVDNTSASPTGDLSTGAPTFQIDVNDSEFPSAQGEEVQVEFFVDGESIGTDTLTANGTASVTASDGLTGGDHTWHAWANDSYGGTQQSQTFSISAPANITIREEIPEPHDIIKNAEVDILLSGDAETVDRRSVTDGNISLQGLSTNEEYVLVIDAPDYHLRSIVLEDLYDQSTAYLLNTSNASVENTFIVQDNTGEFDQNPRLFIQRPINRSLYDDSFPAEYQWITVAGDRLGSDDEYTVDLAEDDRYRIIIKNTRGDTRVLGEYTAKNSGDVTLTVGEIGWNLPSDAKFNWSFVKDTSASPSEVRFTYVDPQQQTTDLEGVIFEHGNRSNELATFSTTGPVGEFQFTQDLAPNEENVTWQVRWNATRNGTQIGSTMTTGIDQLDSGVPIYATLAQLDSDWQRAVSAMAILAGGLITGGAFSGVGALIVLGIGFTLWFVGLGPWGASIVILAAVAAISFRLQDRTGEGL